MWELAEHRYLYIVELPGARRLLHCTRCSSTTSMTGSSDIGARGLEPAEQETYENGVRKVIYRDPDGNEIGFGGAPLE